MAPSTATAWREMTNLDLEIAGAIVAASLVLGLVLRWLASRAITRWAKRSQTRVDDEIVASLRRPFPVWAMLAGLALVSRRVMLPEPWPAVVDKAILVSAIASVTVWLAGVGVRILDVVGAPGRGGEPVRVTGVARHVVRILILVVGTLVVLGTLDISITPILTTLGIGGLAVALALKDTLENLFAGIHVTLARGVRVGDFVRLETGDEGTVEDIGWRTTRIRLLGNSIVLVPNARLAQSVVTNHDLPIPEVAVLVEVGVHYASDLERVQSITRDVGAEVMKNVVGGVPQFVPFIRFHTFGESSVDFTVILRAARYVDRFLVKHEFITRLHKRFATERIVIPFPIRALNLDQEQLGASPVAAGVTSAVRSAS